MKEFDKLNEIDEMEDYPELGLGKVGWILFFIICLLILGTAFFKNFF